MRLDSGDRHNCLSRRIAMWRSAKWSARRTDRLRRPARAEIGPHPRWPIAHLLKVMLGMSAWRPPRRRLRAAESCSKSSRANTEWRLYSARRKCFRAWARRRLKRREAARLEVRRGLAGLRRTGRPSLLGMYTACWPNSRPNAGARTGAGSDRRRVGAAGRERANTARCRTFIAFAAKSCSSAIRTIPCRAEEAFSESDRHREASKARAASFFSPRCALAKLYQSIGRPVEAYAVLAPALEGFRRHRKCPRSPRRRRCSRRWRRRTRSRPQRAAAATDAVARRPTATRSSRRAATARRKRRKRSQEPASGRLATRTRPRRLAADYGLWVGSFSRGELPSMRAHASGLPRRRRGEAQFARGRRRPSRRRDHTLVRRRVSRGAGSSGTRAGLVPTRPRRRSGISLRTGPRRRRNALSGAHIVADRRDQAGDFAHRRGTARIADLAHVGTRALWKMHSALFELMRGNHARAALKAVELAQLAREHELTMWRRSGSFSRVGRRLERRAGGLEDMRAGSNCCASRTSDVRRAIEDCAGRG